MGENLGLAHQEGLVKVKACWGETGATQILTFRTPIWLVSICISRSPTPRMPCLLHPQLTVRHHEWCGDLWQLFTEQHLSGLPISYLLSLPPLYSLLQVLIICFISNRQQVRLSPLPYQQSMLLCDSVLPCAIIYPINPAGISEFYHLGKHDSLFLKSLHGIHVSLTFTRANIHYKVYCLAICCSSHCESLKQYKSQSFKTDSNDKSQQYATQHLSNKTGQSIKKIKSSLWYETVIK